MKNVNHILKYVTLNLNFCMIKILLTFFIIHINYIFALNKNNALLKSYAIRSNKICIFLGKVYE